MEMATVQRLLGKSFLKALLLGLLPSAQPFFTAKDRAAEPAIVGTFAPEAPDEPFSPAERETLRISVSKKDPLLYNILLKDKNGEMEFDAALFKLAGSGASPGYFMDWSPRRAAEGYFPEHARHMAVKVEWEKGGTLGFSSPKPEDRLKAAAAVASEPPSGRDDCDSQEGPVYSAGDYCSRVLTAPTPALQGLLRASLRKEYGETIWLYSVKPAARLTRP